MKSDDQDPGSHALPDSGYLLKLAAARMPFGKYAGVRLIDLPEEYIIWFYNKGLPEGNLGEMLQSVYEIKMNGLEYLLQPFKGPQGQRRPH